MDMAFSNDPTAAAAAAVAMRAVTGAGSAALGAPRASVIIPHLNTPELLVKCLQSVASQRLDRGWFEIIVVDNGSRVRLDVVAAAWTGVTFLREPEPGPGPARNLGAARARGRVLAFVDADIRVAPDWLLRGINAVERDASRPYGGDVRIDFDSPDDPSGIEAFEAVFSFRQKMYIRRKGFSGTGNLMVDRDLFAKVGPFGPIGTAEDAAWGRKAKAMGHPTRYIPRMIVFHPARITGADLEARWGRLIAHDFGKHTSAGKPILFWHMRAYAVILSAAVHVPKLLMSRRVPSIRSRFRGVVVLFQNRWYRFTKMRQMAREGHQDTAMQWNRTP